MFKKIFEEPVPQDLYFQQRMSCANRMDIYAFLKITAAFGILPCKILSDAIDDYL